MKELCMKKLVIALSIIGSTLPYVKAENFPELAQDAKLIESEKQLATLQAHGFATHTLDDINKALDRLIKSLKTNPTVETLLNNPQAPVSPRAIRNYYVNIHWELEKLKEYAQAPLLAKLIELKKHELSTSYSLDDINQLFDDSIKQLKEKNKIIEKGLIEFFNLSITQRRDFINTIINSYEELAKKLERIKEIISS
jgi:hypothetical protein